MTYACLHVAADFKIVSDSANVSGTIYSHRNQVFFSKQYTNPHGKLQTYVKLDDYSGSENGHRESDEDVAVVASTFRSSLFP